MLNDNINKFIVVTDKLARPMLLLKSNVNQGLRSNTKYDEERICANEIDRRVYVEVYRV